MRAIYPDDPDMMESEKCLAAVLKRFTYRPNWHFRVHAGYLQVDVLVDDSNNPTEKIALTFNQHIPRAAFMYKEFDWTRWLFEQVRVMEMHELQEFFRIDGHTVYEPHPELVELNEFISSGRAKIPHDQR